MRVALKNNNVSFLVFFISFLLIPLACWGSDGDLENAGKGTHEQMLDRTTTSSTTSSMTSLTETTVSDEENNGLGEDTDRNNTWLLEEVVERDVVTAPPPPSTLQPRKLPAETTSLALVEESLEEFERKFKFFNNHHQFRPNFMAYDERHAHSSFQDQADTEFLRQISNSKIMTASILGVIIGLPASSGVTAMVLGRAGNLLMIPVGGWQSTFLVTFMMVGTTPPLLRQFYGRSRKMAIWLTGEERFTKQFEPYQENAVSKESSLSEHGQFGDEPLSDEIQVRLCQKTWTHYGMDGVAGASALVDAFVELSMLLFLETKAEYTVFGGITGTSLFLSFFEQALFIKMLNNQKLFSKYLYDDIKTREKRLFLLKMLDYFEMAVAEDNGFGEYSFEKMKGEYDRINDKGSFFSKEKRNFALAHLLLKMSRSSEGRTPNLLPRGITQKTAAELSKKIGLLTEITRKDGQFKKRLEGLIAENNDLKQRYRGLDEKNQKLYESEQRLRNQEFRVTHTSPSLSENFMDYASTLMTGAAFTADWSGTTYLLSLLGTQFFGLDLATASTLAECAAGLELFSNLLQYNTHKENFQSYLTGVSPTSLGDWIWPRRIVHSFAFACGGFLALTKTATSLLGFKSWSISGPSAGVTLVCAGIKNTAYYDQLFNRYGQDLVTATVTTIPEKYTTDCSIGYVSQDIQDWVILNSKRSWLRAWCEELRPHIAYGWDKHTVEVFDRMVQ